MKVIANETLLSLRAIMIQISPKLDAEYKIYKNSLYEVNWHNEITKEDAKKAYEDWQNNHPLAICPYTFPTQKSYILITKIRDESDIIACRKMVEYKLELTREQFEEWFSPIEDHSMLHFHRIDLSSGMSNKDRCDKVNEFIHNTNIKIDRIFEPDSNTIDIWYTKYIGNW